MKMVSKVTMALLAGVLALPVAGLTAENEVDAPKPAAATKQKPKIDAPADCTVTGKKKGSVATEKRKQIHARKGIKSGGEKLVVHDHEAAHEHGKDRDDR